MKAKELTPEQIQEVNFRVKQIIESFREGLYNSAKFDYGLYWERGMSGDGQMSDACKHVYQTKERIIGMLDKEMNIVLNDDFSFYYDEKRKIKDKIIEDMMDMLVPALRGRQNGDQYQNFLTRVVNLSDIIIEKAENLSEYKTNGKFLKKLR